MPDFAYLQDQVNRGVLRSDLVEFSGDYINEALRETQNRHSFASMKNTFYTSVPPGVLASGGNLVPSGSLWPVGGGTLSFALSGFAIGARYYFNQGNAASISADGINPITLTDGFFTATQLGYTILALPTSSGQLITCAVVAAALEQVAFMPTNFKELQKYRPIHYVSDDGGLIPAEVVFDWQQYFRIWAFGGTPISTWPPRIYYERRNANSAVIGIVEPLSQAFNFRVKYYGYLPDLVNPSDTSPIAELYPRMIIAKAKAIAFSTINDPAELQFEEEFEGKFQAALRQDAYSEVVGRDLRM